MKLKVLSAATCGVLASLSTAALAAESAPPASSGFQLGLRTGYAIPLGKVDEEPVAPGEPDITAMSNTFGGQVPFIVDIGGKLSPSIFLGGFLGLGIGGAGGNLKTLCDGSGLSCSTATFRIGAEIFYGFIPDGSVNPWLGYGIGIESSGVGISGNGRSGTVALSGFEFAHLMGGADFRVSPIFGIGPFVDFSLGQYTRVTEDFGTGGRIEGSIANTTMHEWLTLGVRGVFWP